MDPDADVACSPKPLVVIPCLNEAEHIRRLTDQMVRAVAPFGGHIVIVDGGSTDGTWQIAAQLAGTHASVSLLENSARLQSAGINAAVAEFGDGFSDLVRIDAHSAYPDDFIAILLEDASRSGASSVVVGMIAQGNGPIQRLNAATQNSALGNGGSKHRRRGGGEFVEHGHHALIRMEAFRAVGGYDPAFSHNEDAELDHRLTQAGHRIWLTDRTCISYFPRGDLASIARQYFNFGRGRAKNFLKHRMWPKLRQAVVIAVAPVVGLALLGPVHLAFAGPALAWLATILAGGLKLAVAQGSAYYLMSGLIALIMHLSWSLGFWGMVLSQAVPSRRAVPT